MAASDSIKPNETVTFFPTAADFRDGCWHVPVHGWIYRAAESSRLRQMGLWLARRFAQRRVRMDAEQSTLFRKRAAAFLADNNRKRKIQIALGPHTHDLKRSQANGHFKGELLLSPEEVAGAGSVAFHAVTDANDPRKFPGRALLLPQEGLSVISDIDDTIKITGVANRRTMLRKTFIEDFAEVPDMAALYRRWQTTRGAVFHYVSASPWHLYPFLAEFLKAQGFPEGTFHLRDFRLMIGDLHRTLRPSHRIKLTHARSLMKRFPKRKFILVGDSGESDPAIYAKLFREHPDQVERICIRKISPTDVRRWEKACRSLPSNRCHLFEHARELA